MKKLWIIFVVLLAGCSSQFAYNNLDWLVHWYLDDYIDLEKAQKTAFDERFALWHQWHRNSELENYVVHLQELKQKLHEEEVTAEMVTEQFSRARGHWVRLREHIAPDITALARLLTDQQIEEMFASLEKRNYDDEIERQETDQQELVLLFEKRFEKQLKNYFGRLTPEQSRLVSEHVQQVIPNKLQWIHYRRAVQKAAKELLAQRNSENFESAFTALLINPEAYQHAEYIANLAHNRKVFAALVVDVWPTLTEKQQRRLFRKIDDFIDDFTELALED